MRLEQIDPHDLQPGDEFIEVRPKASLPVFSHIEDKHTDDPLRTEYVITQSGPWYASLIRPRSEKLFFKVVRDESCNCCGEGPAPYQDRNGLLWCEWCHENGICTDMMGHHDKPALVLAHITNGRDHDGTEWTLCGLKVTWTVEEHNKAAKAGRWCTKCQDLDG